jgi:hypothetical protein
VRLDQKLVLLFRDREGLDLRLRGTKQVLDVLVGIAEKKAA